MAGSVVILSVHGIVPTSCTLDAGEDHAWDGVEQFEQMLDTIVGRAGCTYHFRRWQRRRHRVRGA
jgi:hypothetical protein